MPRVNKVMEPYDKQMKLTAFFFFREKSCIHNRRDIWYDMNEAQCFVYIFIIKDRCFLSKDQGDDDDDAGFLQLQYTTTTTTITN